MQISHGSGPGCLSGSSLGQERIHHRPNRLSEILGSNIVAQQGGVHARQSGFQAKLAVQRMQRRFLRDTRHTRERIWHALRAELMKNFGRQLREHPTIRIRHASMTVCHKCVQKSQKNRRFISKWITRHRSIASARLILTIWPYTLSSDGRTKAAAAMAQLQR